MTVQELIDLLSDEDPDAEVRFMAQPSWPFEYSLRGFLWRPASPSRVDHCGVCEQPIERDGESWMHASDATLDEDHDAESDSEDGWTPADAPAAGAVYLLEGNQIGYGSKDAWS